MLFKAETTAATLAPTGLDEQAGAPADVAETPRTLRGALVATSLVGATVACAPLIPSVVRSPALVAALVVWAVGMTACIVWGTARARILLRSGAGRGWVILAGVGIAIALVAALQLELVRSLYSRSALFWNGRWFLNHAWAVAQTGGVDRALDYAGAPVNYHVGPAWLAGAVERLFGDGIADILFGLVPGLCTLTIISGAILVLRQCGVRYRCGVAAVAIAMTIPLSNLTVWNAAYAFPGVLLTLDAWPFLATGLMLNSLLGLAVGLASLALMLDRGPRSALAAAGSVGLASVVQIKPQFYVAFALVAGFLGAARLLRAKTLRGSEARLIIAAAASLPLAVASQALLPGDTPVLASPVWTTAESRDRFSEAFRTSTFLVVGALIGWRLIRARSQRSSRTPLKVDLLVVACAVLFALAGTFYFVDFPCRPEVLTRWLELGFERSSACFSHVSASSSDRHGLQHSLVAARFLVVLLGCGLLAVSAEWAGKRWRNAFWLAGGLAVLSPAAVLTRGILRPDSVHEVAEDRGLFEVLGRIPTNGTLLIANDLADPANDYGAPLQGMLLTAYRGHAFYVANLRYVHYVRDDARDRLQALQRFFGTPWSPWHSDWLKRTGVTHVLVHDRCSSSWANQEGIPLRRLGSNGGWTAYQVTHGAVAASSDRAPGVLYERPAYGKAACLWGDREGS